ncbi:MAG: HupE/UreJ family protein [Enhydrobacter sp.]
MTLRTLPLSTSLALSTLLAFAALPALAHPGHVDEGFLHPLTGLDHVLAMVGVGLWAALLASRKPSAIFLLPVAFVVMMAFGAAAGFAGMKLPIAEAGILASVFLLGGLVLVAVRVAAPTAMGVVAMFAIFHGYVHALEAPTADTGEYMLGFLGATAFLLGIGAGLGWIVRRLVGDVGLRALGGLILAGGAYILVTQ